MFLRLVTRDDADAGRSPGGSGSSCAWWCGTTRTQEDRPTRMS